MKYFKSVVSGAVVALTLATTSAAEELTCYTYIPNAQHVTVQGLTAIGDEIERITGGDTEVTCHAGGTLGISAADITAATSDDVIQLASNAFITGAVPIAGIFALPGLFTTEEELAKGLEIVAPFLGEAMAKQDLVYLGAYNYPRQVIFSTRPVVSLADLEGRKIRVSSGEQAEFITRFGGTPVTLGSPEVAQALQLGTISGVMTAASGGARLWTDYLTYNYELGPNFTVSPVFMNADAHADLTADHQDQLREFVAAETARISASMRNENAKLVAQFAENGMTVVAGKASDETLLIETLQDYWPIWAEERGETSKKALQDVRAALGK